MGHLRVDEMAVCFIVMFSGGLKLAGLKRTDVPDGNFGRSRNVLVDRVGGF